MKILNTYLSVFFVKRWFLCCFGLFLCVILKAQLVEDFSDGDFTNNPEWIGELNKFIVNEDDELQLNDTLANGSSNIAQIVVAANTADSTTWEFLVRMDFNPSSSNYLRVYLSADSPNLGGVLNGYLVEIGRVDDAVHLVRQTGDTRNSIITGTPDALNMEPNAIRVKVTRRNGQNWTLAVDYQGEENFVTEGSAQDDTPEMGNFFGFYCRFSSSRKDKFFFDDIVIDPLFVDVLPPEITNVEVLSPTMIDVAFNEILEENTAENVANYHLDNGLNIASAELDANNKTLVHLVLDNAMSNLQDYTLTISGVADEAGNAMENASYQFTFFDVVAATTFDILINEIMADPTPILGLPDAEWIELYNRSDKTITLKDMELASGSNPQLLPDFVLLPDSYVVVCEEANIGLFAGFGEVIGVPSFPALSNGGDEIRLTSPEGILIDAVDYKISWYQNSSKSEGGWTLERINPGSPCDFSGRNWRAAVNGNGGTPSQVNSILERKADGNGPNQLSVFPISTTELELLFDEAMDENTIFDLENYSLSDELMVIDVQLEIPFWNKAILTLNKPLEENIIYTLFLDGAITDCAGNSIASFNLTKFALPEVIEVTDIVLNELLFNPESGGAEFIELYNRSSKNLNIGELIVANRDEEGNINVARPISFDYMLFPGDYVVLTENILAVEDQYSTYNPFNDMPPTFPRPLLEMDLPSLTNDEGTVLIYLSDTLNPLTIDEFAYSDDFHYPLLDNTKGVSLERINPNKPTQDESNWHSAAALFGYATPTYQNSQGFTSTEPIETNEIFSIPNTTFSPDEDGFEDFLLINYQTEQPGFTANIRIYDANGRLIKDLVRSELLAVEGSIKWDGITDAGTKARMGIYVIWLEIFHPDGTVRREKKTCVVAARLD